MKIIDWNPANGDLCQGDVILFAVPAGVRLDLSDEVQPRDAKVILAEGEVTGHHHAIWLPRPVMFRDDGLARELEAKSTGLVSPAEERKPAAGTTRLYRDRRAVVALIRLGELAHERLAIGFLIVEGAPVVLSHDEHDGVRIPPGRYYVGGQSEWDATEERRVAD